MIDEIAPFLGTLPGWGLTIVISLILLNYLAGGKIGELFTVWLNRRFNYYDKSRDELYTILRETTKELSHGVDGLDESMHDLSSRLSDGQASLAVKQSEIRALISSQNVHHTGHHEQLTLIIKQLAVISEKIDGQVLLLMQLSRIRDNKDGN